MQHTAYTCKVLNEVRPHTTLMKEFKKYLVELARLTGIKQGVKTEDGLCVIVNNPEWDILETVAARNIKTDCLLFVKNEDLPEDIRY